MVAALARLSQWPLEWMSDEAPLSDESPLGSVPSLLMMPPSTDESRRSACTQFCNLTLDSKFCSPALAELPLEVVASLTFGFAGTGTETICDVSTVAFDGTEMTCVAKTGTIGGAGFAF